MRALNDYECGDCGNRFERFIDTDIDYVECDCGGMAVKCVSVATISLDGTDAGFPGAYEKWAKIREDNARIKNKRFSAER